MAAAGGWSEVGIVSSFAGSAVKEEIFVDSLALIGHFVAYFAAVVAAWVVVDKMSVTAVESRRRLAGSMRIAYPPYLMAC